MGGEEKQSEKAGKVDQIVAKVQNVIKNPVHEDPRVDKAIKGKNVLNQLDIRHR